MTPLDKARSMAKILDDKKALDVKLLHIGTLTTIGDYFVVATGTSTTQVKALADEVDRQCGKKGILPKRIEGYQSASWVLMDYQDVIVHIFLSETREFYALERLWSDAPVVDAQ
jgi:ribosome-associated protein